MNHYIATFYTHLSAIRTHKTLEKNGIGAKLSPVPRALSSSCGTCIRYVSDDPCIKHMDNDIEKIALIVSEGEYEILHKNE